MAAAVLVLLVLAVASTLIGWRTSATRRHAAAACASGGLLAVVAALGAVSDDATSADDAWIAAAATLCALLAIGGGGPATRFVFQIVDGNRTSPDTAPIGKANRVLRGGSWIGLLERAAVFATLVAGWPEGVAVALAVKGLGRYPELRADVVGPADSAGAAERFIIGTFASVLWAVACAGTATLLT